MTTHDLLLALAFAVVAALYGAVGHGGASGYLAVMGLAGWTAAAMRPTALVLNLIVSLTGTILFHRGGWLRLRLLLNLLLRRRGLLRLLEQSGRGLNCHASC